MIIYSFILEDETGGKKNTWVYVMINQILTPSRLFVYAVSHTSCTLNTLSLSLSYLGWSMRFMHVCSK